MKYIKQPKRHIVLDDFEWRALVKGINEYRKQVIDEDECVDEAMKRRDQLYWVGRMNSIRNRAEEIVLREVIYV